MTCRVLLLLLLMMMMLMLLFLGVAAVTFSAFIDRSRHCASWDGNQGTAVYADVLLAFVCEW